MDLNSPIRDLSSVGPVYVKRLKKLGISKVSDLIYHLPSRYIDYTNVSPINKTKIGEVVTIKGSVTFIKNQYTKTGKKIQLATIEDNSGSIMVIWFNQPYLLNSLKKNVEISVAGKVDWFGRSKAIISPEYELTNKNIHTGRLVPIYPETSGVSSKWLRGRITQAFPLIKDNLEETLPIKTQKKYSLCKVGEALQTAHFPNNLNETKSAFKRLAFDELLLLHLNSLSKKLEWMGKESVYKLDAKANEINSFTDSLPFKLTGSQVKAIKEILDDLKKSVPMNRLLEGDVGSGKTVVAAAGALAAFLSGHQSVFMVPTQILAAQHLETLNKVFADYKIRTSLVTSAGVKGDLGKTDIYIGTHALIHKKINFDNVAYVVIDEQHKFGVEQRGHLTKKAKGKELSPHVLTMTATPIPRTVVLTLYADLSLSTLTELPKGRKKITTWVVPSKKKNAALKWISDQIKKDRVQTFVVCPLIEESDKEIMSQVKAATAEYKEIKKALPNLKIGLLHGRLKIDEKNKVINSFKNNKIDILVSTPVVEVGIDIPNATIMVIEAADRFGLSQLHQLRGRVGRGRKKSYCLLFTQSRSKKTNMRLSAMKKSLSGFELAELDLKMRGPGEIFGTRQSGFPELKIASWQDAKLIHDTKQVAQEAINNSKKYPILIKMYDSKRKYLN